MDRWTTAIIPFEGGLLENVPQISQGINKPGSALDLLNFEPHQAGGYRRVSGFTKFDSAVVPGSGPVLGSFVFQTGVLAARGEAVYRSLGSGWTQINTTARPGAKKYRMTRYNWVEDTVAFVDQVNRPAKWNGTVWTELTNAPLGVVDIVAFKNYLFLAHGQFLTFSAPLNDNDYDTVNGAGQINIGYTIEGLFPWRDQLFVFGRDKIFKLTGTIFGDVAGNDAKLDPVAQAIGCLSRFTLQEVAGDVFFLAADGIRTIAGTADIGDVNLAVYSKPIYKSMQTFIEQYFPHDISTTVVKAKTQYRILGGFDAEADATATGFIMALRDNQTIEFGKLQGIRASCADSFYIGQIEFVIHGGYDGFVYRQESGPAFNGNPVVFNLQLPYNPLGDPEVRKVLYKNSLYVEAEGSDLTFNLCWLFDYGDVLIIQPPCNIFENPFIAFASEYDDPNSNYNDSPPDVYAISRFNTLDSNLVGSCFTVSFKISGDMMTSPFIVKSMNVQHGLGDRR